MDNLRPGGPLVWHGSNLELDLLERVELRFLPSEPRDAVSERVRVVGVPGRAVDAVETARVAAVVPPAALVVKGTVPPVKVIVLVLRAERHAVVVAQRVACMARTGSLL